MKRLIRPATAVALVLATLDLAWRGLVHGPGLGMWTFPDDYPKRVGDAVYKELPAIHREAR